MAETDVSGLNGAVTMPNGHGGVAFGWTLRTVQRKKDISRYGGGRVAQVRGGLLDVTGSVRAFSRKGAANRAPGMAAPDPDGAAFVLTADTGCLETVTAVVDPSINAAFNDPAQEVVYDLTCNAIAETWATT